MRGMVLLAMVLLAIVVLVAYSFYRFDEVDPAYKQTHTEPIRYSDDGTKVDWSLSASDANKFFIEVWKKFDCKSAIPYTAVNYDKAVYLFANIHAGLDCMKGNQ